MNTHSNINGNGNGNVNRNLYLYVVNTYYSMSIIPLSSVPPWTDYRWVYDA